MRKPTIALLVVSSALICATASAQAPAGYEAIQHDTPMGRYASFVPPGFSAMEDLNITEPSPAGIIYGTGYQRLANDQTTLLSMLHYLAPVGFELGRSQQQIVLDTLNGIVQGVGGTIASQRPVTLNGIAGMEAEFSAFMEGMRLLGRVRVYQHGTEAFGSYFIIFPDGYSNDATLWANPRGVAFLDSLQFQAGVGDGGSLPPAGTGSPK